MTSKSREENGYFGEFGGSYVPEALQQVMDVLEEQFYKIKDDRAFNEELQFI